MNIRTITIATTLAAVALTGCGAGQTAVQAVNPWQDDLREVLDEEFGDYSNADVGELCLSLSFLGLDSPGEIGSAVLALDEQGELPSPNMTVGEWAAAEGQSLPFNIPDDLTMREVVNEAGAYILDLCGTEY